MTGTRVPPTTAIGSNPAHRVGAAVGTVGTVVSTAGPGLAVVALGVLTATVAGRLVPQISPLLLAIIVGVVIANTVTDRRLERLRPGLQFAARRLLRIGVVLLGLRLSLGQVLALGAPMLGVVLATVAVTFFGTLWMGRRLGLSDNLSLLVATGYSICGASAIAAVEGTVDADEDEVALSVALVTVAGTAAMFTLPIAASLLGLSDDQFGAWVGAGIHDVAQVVAAGSAGGGAVLATAVVVKLTRVVLLAPLVAGVGVYRQRMRRRAPSSHPGPASKPALLPGFVAGFLAMMLLRTLDVVPSAVLDGVRVFEGLLLGAALVGLGSAVRISRLRHLGGRAAVLGVAAWFLVSSISLAGAALLVD